MGSFARKLKRKKPDEDHRTKGVDHRLLPTGRVTTEPVKGEFQGLPLLAWCGIREGVNTPILNLLLSLMKDVQSSEISGGLHIELPILDDTLHPIVGMLQRFNWEGKVWPLDTNVSWPLPGSVDEQNIRGLLRQSGLRATLLFPPSEQGYATLPVDVQRARGPFLMPPLEPPAEPPPAELLERFQQAYRDPRPFYHEVLPETVLKKPEDETLH